MIIYKLTNKVNGKIYIGQTSVPLQERVRKHFVDAKRGVPTLLYNAIRKHGSYNFQAEIIATGSNLKELYELEKKLIREHNSTDRNVGYNVKYGGEGGGIGYNGWHHSDQSKARIGAAAKGNKHRLGIPTNHSAETRKKISEGAQGSKHGCSKLTEDQVREIRRLGANREWGIGSKLAKQFGVGPQIISFILNRRNWKHI